MCISHVQRLVVLKSTREPTLLPKRCCKKPEGEAFAVCSACSAFPRASEQPKKCVSLSTWNFFFLEVYYCNSLTCRIVSPGNIDPWDGHPALVLELSGEAALFFFAEVFSLKKKINKKGSVIRVGCLSQSLLSSLSSSEKVRPSSAHPTGVLTSILG